MAGKVLIADDSAVARVSIARLVRSAGFEVVEEDSAAGASAVECDGLGCALLDLDLGDGNGADVAAQLRSSAGDLPIAFFTSTSTPEALARAKVFGPIFAKPEELDAAVAWIRKNA